jgi:hypothetical protein
VATLIYVKFSINRERSFEILLRRTKLSLLPRDEARQIAVNFAKKGPAQLSAL